VTVSEQFSDGRQSTRSVRLARGAARAPSGLVRSSTVGMRFDDLLPFEAWQSIGTRVATYANASRWWLGDWLVFGRMKYGRRYKEAITATGLDYQTLRNYAVVARRFDLSRRRDTLSFQHHAELCAFSDDEQDRWLDLAAAGRWSRQELRRRLRSVIDPPAPAHRLGEVRLSIGGARAVRCREAADACSCHLNEWIEHALDEAAASALAGTSAHASQELTPCDPPWEGQ
jgi:hypothetical protein